MATTSTSWFHPIVCNKLATEKPGFCSKSSSCKKITTLVKLRPTVKTKASSNEPATKPNSVICADCDGQGAVQCSQCKGSGVNSIDHFNGQFKAGASCWLCGGKKGMLCGNCNGAGFIGGFMTSSDT